jgi:hypothetical protein
MSYLQKILNFTALGFVLLNMGSHDADMKTFNEVLYVSTYILCNYIL